MNRSEDALALLKLRWSVLPLAPRSKRPLIPWRQWQHRRLSEEKLAKLFAQTPDANIGVVTGRISKLIVVDCDAPEALARLGPIPSTPNVETHRGKHYYFSLPEGPIRSARLAQGLELRAEGGYVVTPTSVHPSGRVYIWHISPFEVEPAPAPAWLLEMVKKVKPDRSCPELDRIAQGTPEGMRNTASAELIGYLLSRIPQDQWEALAWPLIKGWNLLNQPPLDERDLRNTFESIARKERKKRRKAASVTAKILQAALSRFSIRELAKLTGISKSQLARLKRE